MLILLHLLLQSLLFLQFLLLLIVVVLLQVAVLTEPLGVVQLVSVLASPGFLGASHSVITAHAHFLGIVSSLWVRAAHHVHIFRLLTLEFVH